MGQFFEQCCFVLEHAKELAKKILKTFFVGKRLNLWKICEILGEDLFFFGEHFRVLTLVLGLGRVCRCVLDLGIGFFVFLASSLLSSTPPLVCSIHLKKIAAKYYDRETFSVSKTFHSFSKRVCKCGIKN